jgi:homoserine O-acetyltransferase/O-succinyltransferase
VNFVQRSCVIRNFSFTSGETIPELTIGYQTLGEPKNQGDKTVNAVLLLHGTTGSSKQFTQPEMADALFKPGKPLDPAKYFLIIPDAIGHGNSSKPSDGLGAKFPRYSYQDIVNAQHHLVSEELALCELRLVLGTSMGGMQTWMWASQFPDIMRGAVAVASLPERVQGRNVLWRRLLIDMIRRDPGYQGGNYQSQPSALGAAWTLFTLMANSPADLKMLSGPEQTDRYIQELSETAFREQDANDVIWEFDASRDYDPRPELISAPFLAINFTDDEINPVELGVLNEAIERVPKGRAIIEPISPKSRGHQTLRVAEVWAPALERFLSGQSATR